MKRLSGCIVMILLLTAVNGNAQAQAKRPWARFHRQESRRGIPEITPLRYGHDTPRFGITQIAVVDAPVGTAPSRRRPAHFRATSLTIDHIQLDQIGLAIQEIDTDPAVATLIATGRITHSGGTNGGLLGNNVRIRVRAYIGGAAASDGLPADSIMVWESKRDHWIGRGLPAVISLVPDQVPQTKKLKTYFNEITHFEVNLEYTQDR